MSDRGKKAWIRVSDEAHSSPLDRQEAPKRRRGQGRTFLKELPFLVVGALIVAVLLKSFLIQVFYIPSGSMLDTLQINDRVIVNKLAYRAGDPHRGDIVVFEPEEVTPESVMDKVTRNLLESIGQQDAEWDLIKRIVGLPGETIEIQNGSVLINGSPIPEEYLPLGVELPNFGPVEVPANQYFVMGDNRDSSKDSRVFGPINRDRIVGQAFAVVWPPGNWDGL